MRLGEPSRSEALDTIRLIGPYRDARRLSDVDNWLVRDGALGRRRPAPIVGGGVPALFMYRVVGAWANDSLGGGPSRRRPLCE